MGAVIAGIIVALLVAFIAVIVVRALLFHPKKQETVLGESISLNEQKIIADMSAMITCRTVSNRDDKLTEWAEFDKFKALLVERFPNIHSSCTLEYVGKTGLLYHLKGKSADTPAVLMAHYDVVPVDLSRWTKPAFDGLVEEGCIWGRGAIDTKGTLCGVVEALEQLLESGYQPQNDLYLSFSGEEEIDGDTCADIVSYLEQQGVTPALVLDEGGAVVSNVFPGVKGECALIGLGEKGGVNLDFTIESAGGHASTPPIKTNLGRLSRAVCRIEKHPFKYQLVKPVKQMFDILGRESTFVYRLIFANLWCFMPLLDLICKASGGELNAMVRTTVATTRMQGSDAYNVLPSKASFGVNMRLIGTDTVESVTQYLKKTVADDDINISLVNGTNPSIYSTTDCQEWEKLCTAIRMTWEGVKVSPYLMMACSDSRHYCRITDRVYRFSPMRLSKAERGMVHGNDERIPIETLLKTVEFYVRLLKLL